MCETHLSIGPRSRNSVGGRTTTAPWPIRRRAGNLCQMRTVGTSSCPLPPAWRGGVWCVAAAPIMWSCCRSPTEHQLPMSRPADPPAHHLHKLHAPARFDLCNISCAALRPFARVTRSKAAVGVPRPQSADDNMSLPTVDACSDSDWEYEYDETQTEDFYFTLDLPGTVDRPTKRRKTYAEVAGDEGAAQPPRTQHVSDGDNGRQASEPRSSPIKFTGLHSTTPSVVYGEQHYDCRWTTDLGTQFHVSRPGLTKTPFRPGHAVDVVAVSRVRLTGCRITPPPSPKTSGKRSTATDHSIVLDDDDDEAEDDRDPNGSTRTTPFAGGQPQLSFLERVAEIQRKKGEQTQSGAAVEKGTHASDPSPAIS